MIQDTKNNHFFGTESIGKLLWKMSVPAIIAQILNLLYNVVDRIYMAPVSGDGIGGLVAITVCEPIIMIVAAFAALVIYGGAPKASLAMGKGDLDEAEKILGNSLSLQLIISVFLTVILLLFNRFFLGLLGADESNIEYAAAYLSVYALGIVFVQLTLGMNAFIIAQGFAKTAMVSVLIGVICNIILDPIFVFGFHMGVRGAAIATVISQAVSAIWVLHFLTGKKTIIRIRKKNLALKAGIVLPVIVLGLAPFVMLTSENVISFLFRYSVSKYGGVMEISAMLSLFSAMQLFMIPLLGVSQGALPISSYNYGAKNMERVKKIVSLLLVVSLVYSFIAWAFIMLFPERCAGGYVFDATSLACVKLTFRIYCAALGIFGVQVACQTIFISFGDAISSLIVVFVRRFVMLLLLLRIMPRIIENPFVGIYLTRPVTDVIVVGITLLLFYFQFRKSLQKIA